MPKLNPNTLKKLNLYKTNPDLVKDVSANELADLVIVLLNSINFVENSIASGQADISGAMTKQVNALFTEYKTDSQNIKAELKSAISGSKQQIKEDGDNAKSELKKALQRLNERVSALTNGDNGVVTEAEVQRAAQMALGMLELPDFAEMVSTSIQSDGEAIRNALELLVGEERYAVEIVDVKGLEDRLKQLAVTSQGSPGGTSKPAVYRFIRDAIADGIIGGGSSLPDQSGNNGKFLSTDGTDASWETVSAGSVDVVSNVATDRILGRTTAGTGDSEQLTASEVRTLINVEDDSDKTDTANVEAAGALMDSELSSIANVKGLDQDVSNGAAPVLDGTNFTNIPAGTVDVVSNVATATILGRDTAGAGNSEELSASAVRTLINVADGATSNTGALADLDTVDTAQIDDDAITNAKIAGTGTRNSSTFYRGDGTFAAPAGGGDALVANPLSQFAATTSAQLRGVLSDETGTGAAVFGTSPTLTTPALGTPSALVATNATGTAAGLTVGATTGVEAGADVTDATNVSAAGALMDSEVDNLSQVKAFDSTDYATSAQGSTADSALQDVVDDTSPQLGGDLDVNGNNITSTAGLDIAIGASAGNDFTIDTNKFVVEGDTGNVGIGTTVPGSKLSVNGGISAGTYSATAAPSNGMIISGNVGIGTTAPTQTLDIGAGSMALLTTTSATSGIIFKGADRFIHNFNLAGTNGQNTFVGINAGNFTMTGSTGSQGSYNTGIGQNALFSNTTGTNNTANGQNALYANTTGSQNTANGRNALFSNTTGTNNTANGQNALYANTTGSNNTANGRSALLSNTTGIQNTAIGQGALQSNTTGGNNTALGLAAGQDVTTASNNTLIGRNTGRGITTGSNNTILGANVTGLAAGLANNIILADGAGNQRLNITSTGNVGIGTTTPDTKLQVAGAITQQPLSSDPADPDAGNSVQWVSDGTGTGDAGDVLLKVNVGGTTKIITLIDYSVA